MYPMYMCLQSTSSFLLAGSADQLTCAGLPGVDSTLAVFWIACSAAYNIRDSTGQLDLITFLGKSLTLDNNN